MCASVPGVFQKAGLVGFASPDLKTFSLDSSFVERTLHHYSVNVWEGPLAPPQAAQLHHPFLLATPYGVTPTPGLVNRSYSCTRYNIQVPGPGGRE